MTVSTPLKVQKRLVHFGTYLAFAFLLVIVLLAVFPGLFATFGPLETSENVDRLQT